VVDDCQGWLVVWAAIGSSSRLALGMVDISVRITNVTEYQLRRIRTKYDQMPIPIFNINLKDPAPVSGYLMRRLGSWGFFSRSVCSRAR